MARANPAELPGSMAVLGLVIERPNHTVSEIGQLLESRFTRSRFSLSTAHNALPQMVRSRIKRVRLSYKSPVKDSEDRYVPTDEGIAVFRSWMMDWPSAMPPLREAMYGRIEFCRLEDLPLLVKMCRQEESISDDLYHEAAKELRRHRRRKESQRHGDRDFLGEIREVLLYVDPMHWAARSERYKEIAKRLEEIERELKERGLPGSRV